MATTVRNSLKVVVDIKETVGAINAGDRGVVVPHLFELAKTYASGTGDNQQDKVYSTTQTGTGSTDTDLTSATNEATGVAISLATVRGFLVYNHSTTDAETITVGAGSNPWITWLIATGDGVVIGPGGVLLVTSPQDGWAVTGGTGDILRTTNSASLTWTLIVWGDDV